MKFRDLTGDTFGKLAVNGIAYKKGSKYYWDCDCLCGGHRIVAGDYLKNGKITDCGCVKKRPSNFTDLTGQKFGHLTVLREYDRNDKDRVHWICECDCENHNISVVSTSNLKSGHVTKCKECAAKETSERCLIDLTGQRFGRLVVIERAENYVSPSGDTNTMWKCQCDCGNITVVAQNKLRGGTTVSCGCYNREVCSELQLENLEGQRFGMLTVISRANNIYHPNGSYSVAWNCLCDCGAEVVVQAGNLKSGHTTSCGCIQSKGEAKIKKYLLDNNINYKPQYKFEDCVYIGVLRYDFAIFDDRDNLLFLCEYDGQQHFEPVRFGNFSYEEAVKKYDNLVIRDNIKNKYCDNHNIDLLRIPYYDYDNIESILSNHIKMYNTKL